MLPPAKRTKHAHPQTNLNKPFRSPLHRSPQHHLSKEQSPAPDSRLQADRVPLLSVTTPSISDQKQSGPRSSTAPHPEHKDLQKQYSSLSLQLTRLRRSLDSARQALQIESSNQDAELRNLTQKWKAVAQEAAEELFADAKERVDRMGGVKAWQQRCQEDARFWNDDEAKDDSERDDRDVGQVDLKSSEATAELDMNSLAERENHEELGESVSRIWFYFQPFPERPNMQSPVLHHGHDA